MLIWALCANHGTGDLIHTGPTAIGNTLHWNTIYGLQTIIGAFGTGCLGSSGVISLLFCSSSSIQENTDRYIHRLDKICSNSQRCLVRPDRHCTNKYMCDSTMWTSYHIRDSRNVWRSTLESIPASSCNPARLDECSRSSRYLLCGSWLSGQCDRTMHSHQFHCSRHGYSCPLPQIYQYSSRKLYNNDYRFGGMSLELCDTSIDFHNCAFRVVCFPEPHDRDPHQRLFSRPQTWASCRRYVPCQQLLGLLV